MTPACGALTFKFVLSVSISAIASSADTLSPTFFNNRIVPSFTDSGNEGVATLIESTNSKINDQFQFRGNENIQNIGLV
jgi:hypothetical protein